MGDSSSKDMIYRIVSVAAGDGFDKTARSADEAGAKLDEFGRRVDEENGKEIRVRVRVEDSDEDKLKQVGRDADNSDSKVGALAGRFAFLAGAAGTLGGALGAVPVAMGGMIAAGAVLTLGLGGIISALHAYGQESGSAGVSSAQLAQTAFSNAQAIKSAQQGITDAQRQASQQAQSSADSIRSAQQSVADAYRSAGIAAQNSADSVASAEERLAQAQQTAAQAQQSLTQARKDEASTLIQLNLSAATAALDVRAAEFALTDARKAQAQTNQSLTATAEDKQKAELAVEQAQQNLINVQQRATDATAAATDANAKGVEGSATVVAAKQAEATAQQQLLDAQHAVVVAQRNAAEQQVSSNEAIAKSQQALATAQRTAAQQQVSSNEAVAKAVQNLADTEKQQELAAAAAAQSGSAGAGAFAKAMESLTPIGRQVVYTVLGMRGELTQLRDTSQNAIGPGVINFLHGVIQFGPTANGGLRDMGTAIGGVSTQFGTLLSSPAFQGDMGKVFQESAGLASDLGDGVVKLVGGVAQAGAQSGAITKGLGTGFQQLLGAGIPTFFQNLTRDSGGLGQTLQGVLGFASQLLGPLGTIVGAVGSALAPAFQVLTSPSVQKSLVSIGDSIARILVVLTPVVTMFAQGLAGALQIVAPMLDSVAKFFEDNHRWVVPLAQAIGIATIAFWGLNAALDANPLVLVAGLFAGLVGGIIYAWEHFAGFRDFVHTTWDDIKRTFDGAVKWVEDSWTKFTKIFTTFSFGNIGLHLWDWLGAGMKDAVNGVVYGMNWVIDQINNVTQGLSDTWSWAGIPSIGHIDHVHGLATGGTIASGGMVMVGERGPELVQLPTAARVFSNPDSRSMLSSGAQTGTPDRFTAELNLKLNGQQLDKVMVEFQRQGGVSQAIRTGALAALGTVAR